MATRREPRFKLSRHLGVNVCGHPKAMKRVDTKKPARGGQKVSQYALQLMEKQKIKANPRHDGFTTGLLELEARLRSLLP